MANNRFLFRKTIAAAALTLLLSACADKAPVPGGTDNVNGDCFGSISEMQAHIIVLKPGMTEAEVLHGLCSKKESIQRLERRDIRVALLGGENVLFADKDAADTDSGIIRDLYGYRIVYRNLKRKLGFTSPIRIRTDENGYDYTLTLIFHDGKLFERPILSGGPVKSSSSHTIFEALTPGLVIDKAVP